MATIASLIVNIGARTADLERGLAKGRKETAAFAAEIRSLSKLGKFGAGVFGLDIGVHTLENIVRWFAKVGEHTEEVKRANAEWERLTASVDRAGASLAQMAAPPVTDFFSASAGLAGNWEVFARIAERIGGFSRGDTGALRGAVTGGIAQLGAAFDRATRQTQGLNEATETAADRYARMATQARIAAQATEELNRAQARAAADMKLHEQTRSPAERIRQQVLDLQGAFERGQLGIGNFGRGLQEQLQRAQQLLRPPQAGAGEALIAGSAAATSFETGLRSQAGPQDIVSAIKELTRLEAEQNAKLIEEVQKFLKATEEGGVF